LCNEIRIFKVGLRYSFIYHGNLTRRQRRDLLGFRVKLPPVTSLPVKSLIGRGMGVGSERQEGL